MDIPEQVNAILDSLEVGGEEHGLNIDRPIILGVIPPKSVRAIVTFPNGRAYSVTVELAHCTDLADDALDCIDAAQERRETAP